MRYEQTDDRNQFGEKMKTFGRWLANRPMESWGFFAAGVVLARLFF